MSLSCFSRFLSRKPMRGLLDHYEPVSKGLAVLEEALNGYLAKGVSRGFLVLAAEMDRVEAQADKIKRTVRNHLPHTAFMAVDKTLFLNYTRGQDNILDLAQDALHWLGMRPMTVPEPFHAGLLDLLAKVSATVSLLKPAIAATLSLVHGGPVARSEAKEIFHDIRRRHTATAKAKHKLLAEVYNQDVDFKDIHQLIHFIEFLHEMSHNTEGCGDILRAMIAR